MEKQNRINSFFIPVKVTDKRWADRLMDGEVFMRPLKAFVAYENSNVSEDDSFRGDYYEGISSISLDVENDIVARQLDIETRKKIKGIVHIDNADLPFYKLFCLYCARYNLLTESFDRPDSRMRQFGDTVVIFRDFNAFLNRVLAALKSIYGVFFVLLCDHVEYLDLENTKEAFPLFSKRPDYSYQNELRLVISELDKRGGEFHEIKKSLEDIKLYVGDIRDIADEIPFEDFISLKGMNRDYVFPISLNPKIKTIYSKYADFTRMVIDFNLRNSSRDDKSIKSVYRIGFVRASKDKWEKVYPV